MTTIHNNAAAVSGKSPVSSFDFEEIDTELVRWATIRARRQQQALASQNKQNSKKKKDRKKKHASDVQTMDIVSSKITLDSREAIIFPGLNTEQENTRLQNEAHSRTLVPYLELVDGAMHEWRRSMLISWHEEFHHLINHPRMLLYSLGLHKRKDESLLRKETLKQPLRESLKESMNKGNDLFCTEPFLIQCLDGLISETMFGNGGNLNPNNVNKNDSQQQNGRSDVSSKNRGNQDTAPQSSTTSNAGTTANTSNHQPISQNIANSRQSEMQNMAREETRAARQRERERSRIMTRLRMLIGGEDFNTLVLGTSSSSASEASLSVGGGSQLDSDSVTGGSTSGIAGANPSYRSVATGGTRSSASSSRGDLTESLSGMSNAGSSGMEADEGRRSTMVEGKGNSKRRGKNKSDSDDLSSSGNYEWDIVHRNDNDHNDWMSLEYSVQSELNSHCWLTAPQCTAANWKGTWRSTSSSLGSSFPSSSSFDRSTSGSSLMITNLLHLTTKIQLNGDALRAINIILNNLEKEEKLEKERVVSNDDDVEEKNGTDQETTVSIDEKESKPDTSDSKTNTSESKTNTSESKVDASESNANTSESNANTSESNEAIEEKTMLTKAEAAQTIQTLWRRRSKKKTNSNAASTRMEKESALKRIAKQRERYLKKRDSMLKMQEALITTARDLQKLLKDDQKNNTKSNAPATTATGSTSVHLTNCVVEKDNYANSLWRFVGKRMDNLRLQHVATKQYLCLASSTSIARIQDTSEYEDDILEDEQQQETKEANQENEEIKHKRQTVLLKGFSLTPHYNESVKLRIVSSLQKVRKQRMANVDHKNNGKHKSKNNNKTSGQQLCKTVKLAKGLRNVDLDYEALQWSAVVNYVRSLSNAMSDDARSKEKSLRNYIEKVGPSLLVHWEVEIHENCWKPVSFTGEREITQAHRKIHEAKLERARKNKGHKIAQQESSGGTSDYGLSALFDLGRQFVGATAKTDKESKSSESCKDDKKNEENSSTKAVSNLKNDGGTSETDNVNSSQTTLEPSSSDEKDSSTENNDDDCSSVDAFSGKIGIIVSSSSKNTSMKEKMKDTTSENYSDECEHLASFCLWRVTKVDPLIEKHLSEFTSSACELFDSYIESLSTTSIRDNTSTSSISASSSSASLDTVQEKGDKEKDSVEPNVQQENGKRKDNREQRTSIIKDLAKQARLASQLHHMFGLIHSRQSKAKRVAKCFVRNQVVEMTTALEKKSIKTSVKDDSTEKKIKKKDNTTGVEESSTAAAHQSTSVGRNGTTQSSSSSLTSTTSSTENESRLTARGSLLLRLRFSLLRLMNARLQRVILLVNLMNANLRQPWTIGHKLHSIARCIFIETKRDILQQALLKSVTPGSCNTLITLDNKQAFRSREEFTGLVDGVHIEGDANGINGANGDENNSSSTSNDASTTGAHSSMAGVAAVSSSTSLGGTAQGMNMLNNGGNLQNMGVTSSQNQSSSNGNSGAGASKGKNSRSAILESKCLFVQLYHALAVVPPRKLRCDIDHRGRLFEIKLKNEAGMDWGGIYRDCMERVCDDLFSDHFDLNLPCPNQRNKCGKNMGTFLPNPLQTSPLALRMFEFVGRLMGIAIRTRNYLFFRYPACFWKMIAGHRWTLNDLSSVDIKFANKIRKIKAMTPRAFENTYGNGNLTFTVQSADGKTVSELIPNGSAVPVTAGNRNRYISLAITYRLQEFARPAAAIRRGLAQLIPARALTLCTGADLQVFICGDAEVSVERLRAHTEYSGWNENHASVQRFWKVFDTFTNDERSKFLRFVWGRSRLPRGEDWSTTFKLTRKQGSNADNDLPIGHTCFFQIELPAYSSEDIMKKRLLVAIHYGVGEFMIA
eukprot:g2843.t1